MAVLQDLSDLDDLHLSGIIASYLYEWHSDYLRHSISNPAG